MPSTPDAPDYPARSDLPEKWSRPQKLAVFGAYSDHDLYQRNRILVELLKELSSDFVDIRPPARASLHGLARGQSLAQSLRQNFKDALYLWSKRRLLDDCDTVFVPYPAYLGMMLLYFAGRLRGRQIIADAFLEIYSTVVEDRALLSQKSLGTRVLLFLQRATLGRADLIFIDTQEQAAQLRARLGHCRAAVMDLPVGIDEAIWHPLPARPLAANPQQEDCRVLFWGTFIPLHGTDCIAAAALILERRGEPIQLRVIGDGQTAPAFAAALEAQPLHKLSWERSLVDSATLAEEIADAHMVLGVFGASAKAASVVPYKVHQALACNRPLITRDSPAMTEAGDFDAGLVLCPPGNPEALADAIAAMTLRLRAGWRANTRAIYEQRFANAVLRERLACALPLPADEVNAC
ncbi:MAG: glycosyltransferase [Congregibacter sp.]